jgi:Protein of unknown function (DUF3892)
MDEQTRIEAGVRAGARTKRQPSGGGGVVARREAVTVQTANRVDRLIEAAGGAARAHVVTVSAPGDAVSAHADTDHGTILYTAQVRVVFWGSEWVSAAAPVTMFEVMADVESILGGPYLAGLQQYGVSGAHLDRVILLTNEEPPNPFSDDDAADRVGRLMDDGVVPEPEDDNPPAVYAVFLPNKVNGSVMALPPGEVGFHNTVTQFDNWWFHDGFVAWVGNDGTRQSISQNFSHELVEALTDPDGGGWQVEPRSRFHWNEICDVCNGTVDLNGVSVSAYWSNQDNACIITNSTFTTYSVEWIFRPRRIEWMGGRDEDGNAWQLPRQAIMDRIRAGDKFKVHGATTNRDSFVGIYYLDATHPYLATNMDGAPDDNLLSLPQRPPS